MIISLNEQKELAIHSFAFFITNNFIKELLSQSAQKTVGWLHMLYCQIRMQALKSTRRKRKDPQSRDFTCRCGKTYLSYPAAYTHVKNKHKLDKQFLDDIGKPPREHLPRGRPKEKKEVFNTKEIQRLSIIEDTILRMHQMLNASFPKMILQGNNILSSEELQKADQKLFQSIHSRKLSIKLLLRGSIEDHEFVREINRHFSAEIAAKVKCVVLAVSQAQNETKLQQQENRETILNELNTCNLWKGIIEVNELLSDAYLRWKSLKTNK